MILGAGCIFMTRFIQWFTVLSVLVRVENRLLSQRGFIQIFSTSRSSQSLWDSLALVSFQVPIHSTIY